MAKARRRTFYRHALSDRGVSVWDEDARPGSLTKLPDEDGVPTQAVLRFLDTLDPASVIAVHQYENRITEGWDYVVWYFKPECIRG